MRKKFEKPDDAQDVTALVPVSEHLPAPTTELQTQLHQLRAMLTDATEHAEEELAKERELVDTPLSVLIEIISCEFASAVLPANSMIPEYTFHTPCVFGKSRPNQDCRDCAHVQFFRYGSGDEVPLEGKRYPRHGMVIPLRNDAQADSLATYLNAVGALPLKRHVHRIALIQKRIAELEALEAEENARQD